VTTAGVRAGIVKELRALFVPWLLILSAVIMAGLADGALLAPITVIGVVSLGAWSIGHEYTHRTLPLLLSQPVGRRTLALVKAACLTLLLFVVCATAAMFTTPGLPSVVIGGGFAAALSLAPLLTMVSRSVRGGILFTLALGLVWVMVGIRTGEAIAVRNPDRWPDPFGFAESVVYGGFIVIFCVTAVLGWRWFHSLSAVGEQAEHLALPDHWRGRWRVLSPTARTSHPLAALLRKELGLQMPVFVLSAVYALAWVGGWSLHPETRESLAMVTTMLHGGLVPMLAGALASAEERRMGTLAGQLLQPVSASVQWVLKAAVVVSLAVLLAVGLPFLLQLLDSALFTDHSLRQVELRLGFYRLRGVEPMVLVVTMLAALSLYVSSLARNSLHALLASIAAGVLLWNGLAYGMRLLSMAQNRFIMELLRRQPELIRAGEVRRGFFKYSREITHAYETMVFGMVVIVTVGSFWLFLRFGNENHRFDDHRFGRIALQVTMILLVPIVALAFYNGLPALIFGD